MSQESWQNQGWKLQPKSILRKLLPSWLYVQHHQVHTQIMSGNPSFSYEILHLCLKEMNNLCCNLKKKKTVSVSVPLCFHSLIHFSSCLYGTPFSPLLSLVFAAQSFRSSDLPSMTSSSFLVPPAAAGLGKAEALGMCDLIHLDNQGPFLEPCSHGNSHHNILGGWSTGPARDVFHVSIFNSQCT